MKSLLAIIIAIVYGFLNNDKTQQNVWNEINKQEILYPDIVMQTAILETQCGTTGVGKYRDNLFGFRVTKEYINFSDSTDTWKACVRYYKNWQDRKYSAHLYKYHKNSTCNYYCFIESTGWKSGKPYSTDEKKYTQTLRKISIKWNELE